MKKFIVDKMKHSDDYNTYFDDKTDNSISTQKDYLVKEIEQLSSQLLKIPNENKDIIGQLENSKQILENINDATFSLSKILETHRVFQSSRVQMLPKTLLFSQYSFNTKESDFRSLITYSLLNNKIYQAYLYSIKPYLEQFKRSEKMKFDNPKNIEVDFKKILELCRELLKITINSANIFIKQLPGISDLPNDYIFKLIKRGTIDFYTIGHSSLFVDGEYYFYFENGVHFSRELTNKLRGKEKTDIKFDAAESLNKLNLSLKEKSILCAYLFTIIDEDFNAISNEMNGINEFYKKALLYEFDINNRDENFINLFEKVLEKLIKNRQIHSKED